MTMFRLSQRLGLAAPLLLGIDGVADDLLESGELRYR